MRLSVLVFAVIPFIAVGLLAQHSSGGGGGFSGSSGGGGSHGGYSGGSSSSASSGSSHSSSSSAGHVSSTSTPATHTAPSSNKVSSAPSQVKENSAPEKKGIFSFFHHKKTEPAQSATFLRPTPCRKAPCGVCPPGQSHTGAGGCAPVTNTCSSGQYWSNGYSCGGGQAWANNCRALADQLAAQKHQTLGQDPGQSLRYQMLRNQYNECVRRFGLSGLNSAYAFNNPFLLSAF